MFNASYLHKVTYCFTRYRCNILFDIIQQQEKQWERPYTYRHVGVIDLQLLAPQNRCNTFHILIKACELLLFVCFLNIKPIYNIIILNWNVSHGTHWNYWLLVISNIQGIIPHIEFSHYRRSVLEKSFFFYRFASL